MEITFLGTAASEGYPVAFCGCENCQRARDLGGPNLRHRAAALIDGVLLLDLGPDVMAASLALGVPLTEVRYCLLTHEHEDHLAVSHLLSRGPRNQVETPCMSLYATDGALDQASAALTRHLPPGGLRDPAVQEQLNLRLCPIAAGEAFAAGPYRVTAVPAAHDDRISPLLYIIERDGQALFYATDTGPLPEAAWVTLAAWGGRLNLVVLDHTFGMKEGSRGHNNADQFVATLARLRANGLLAEGCRAFAHHLGHHSHPDHATLSAYAAGRGYEAAHDGLTVRL